MPNRQYQLIEVPSGKWAIRFAHIDYYEHFLFVHHYYGLSDFVSPMGYKDEATLFDDPCEARGALQYMCEVHPEMCQPDSVLNLYK